MMEFIIGLIVFILLVSAIVGFLKALFAGSINSSDKSYRVKLEINSDDILEGKIKLGTPRIEYLKSGGVKKITIPVSFDELKLQKDVGAKTVDDLKEKVGKLLSQWAEKYKKQIAKEKENTRKDAFKEFSLATIEEFKIDVNASKVNKPGKVTFNLEDEVNIIDKSDSEFFKESVKFNGQRINNFIFSGQFNSVMGVDGLNVFKKSLLDFLNSNQNKNLLESTIRKLVYENGIHYEYEVAPEKLRNLDDNSNWKALLRLALKYTKVEHIGDLKLLELQKNHRVIFDDFTDDDIHRLNDAVKETANYLCSDINTFKDKLNEKISA